MPAYIVLFRYDLLQFWVHNLCRPALGWKRMDNMEYKAWLSDKAPGPALLATV